jgi:molybdopterin converting factor small subunit
VDYSGQVVLVKVLVFGPLAEELGGREHQITLPSGSAVRFLVEEMGLDHWLGQGLALAVNGNRVEEDFPLTENDEVALLPPVSGG